MTTPPSTPRPSGAADSGAQPSRPGAATPRPPSPIRREVPVEDERSRDDSDEGWGESPGRDDDDRYLRERPPHWG
ncbi:hypothetical protein ACFFKU_07165 [Kineococcus gynurae]|uniref:Uncharacterized protein n=1 Tax=Kineococcus gynurae TaxID=452979 RepID=A0ABV5LWS3_9ACTN